MKKLLISASATLTLISSTAFAVPTLPGAPSPMKGWYTQAIIGASQLNPVSTNFVNDVSVKTLYSTGYHAGIALGYELNSGLAIEGQLGHLRNNMKKAKVAGLGSVTESGNANATYLMANVEYRFNNSSNFVPYVGLGAGAAKVNHNWKKATVNGVTYSTPLKDKATTLVYQGILGLGYNLSNNWMLSLDYRYIGTNKAAYKINDSSNNQSGTVHERYQNQTLNLGILYRFS